jgi:hypothetical protein
MEKSIKISNDFKKEQPEDLQNILKKVALSEEETKKTNEYMERFKLKLISEFRKDYIDSNIITEDILFLEINKWIDYL